MNIIVTKAALSTAIAKVQQDKNRFVEGYRTFAGGDANALILHKPMAMLTLNILLFLATASSHPSNQTCVPG